LIDNEQRGFVKLYALNIQDKEKQQTQKGDNMPGNIITINNADEWYVGDSKMYELLEWLNKKGFKEEKQKGVRHRKQLKDTKSARCPR